MSHLVTIQCEIRDKSVVALACKRLGLDSPAEGTAELFSSQATGQIVRLPRWPYPVVFDTERANVLFDNYQGKWGDSKELEKFFQAYAVENAKLEARKLGRSATEQELADGWIKVSIQVGEGASL